MLAFPNSLMYFIKMLLYLITFFALNQSCTDMWMRIERTLTIWKGMGMSLQGVRTCGDYMFSGHTAIVTMLNFFITECEWHVLSPVISSYFKWCIMRWCPNGISLCFRHSKKAIFFTHSHMGDEHIWYILYPGSPWALFHWCICLILLDIQTVPLLSFIS